jgi:hypothetical protein
MAGRRTVCFGDDALRLGLDLDEAGISGFALLGELGQSGLTVGRSLSSDLLGLGARSLDATLRVLLGGLEPAGGSLFGRLLGLGETPLGDALGLGLGLLCKAKGFGVGLLDALLSLPFGLGLGGRDALVGGLLQLGDLGGSGGPLTLDLGGDPVSLLLGRAHALGGSLLGGLELLGRDLTLCGFIGLQACGNLCAFASSLLHQTSSLGTGSGDTLLGRGAGRGKLFGERCRHGRGRLR